MKKWFLIILTAAPIFPAVAFGGHRVWAALQTPERVEQLEVSYIRQQELNEKWDRDYEQDRVRWQEQHRWEVQQQDNDRQWQAFMRMWDE